METIMFAHNDFCIKIIIKGAKTYNIMKHKCNLDYIRFKSLEILVFWKQGCIKLIKSDSKDIWNVTFNTFEINAVLLNYLTFYSVNLKKKYHGL